MPLFLILIGSQAHLATILRAAILLLAFLYLVYRMKKGFATKEQEKVAAEDFITSLGILPKHNYLSVYRGWSPFFHQNLRGNGLYGYFIQKSYLLIFTPTELIVKNDDPTTKNAETIRIKPTELEHFTVRSTSDDNYCLSLTYQQRNYYFYGVQTTTFQLLLENGFYVLLTTEPS